MRLQSFPEPAQLISGKIGMADDTCMDLHGLQPPKHLINCSRCLRELHDRETHFI